MPAERGASSLLDVQMYHDGLSARVEAEVVLVNVSVVYELKWRRVLQVRFAEFSLNVNSLRFLVEKE